MLNNKSLVNFLKKQNPNAKLLDKLKIVYRPYICPLFSLLKVIPTGRAVFDIGCGSGQFALLLAHYRYPSKIKGIEISETLIRNAKSLLEKYASSFEIIFEKYNGDEIPNDIAEYDFVTMIDVGHHIPKKQQLLFFEQLYSKMKSGSTLLYKDIDAASPFVYANKLHDLLLSSEIGNELSAKATKAIFEKLGFKIVRASKKRMFWYPHFTLIAKKL